MLRLCGPCALLLGLALLASPLAVAGPYDARVGETRMTYKPQGTSLREQRAVLAQATAVVPYGTRIRVLEVRQPWLKVRSPQGTGWLRSPETVEPSALAPNPPPIRVRNVGGGTSQRDISAAGRQLDASAEQRYRQSRADLRRAFEQVDEMERETQALHPAESVGFIVGGALGRKGRDYARPPRLPPPPELRSVVRSASSSQPGRGGRLGRLFGNANDYVKQLRQEFLAEQEYFLGRAVAASAIAKYGVDPSPARRRYVRLVGDAIVRLSNRIPPNFGGYHFEVLDSDEINGISGPGGFVLVTRGVVEACRTEDELASVLAHELAHVTRKDGEATLRSGHAFPSLVKRFGQAVGTVTSIGSARWGRAVFDLYSKVVGELTRTSIEHDYGALAEFGADLEGTYILADVVYDHAALRDFLHVVASRPGGAFANAATHAPPNARIARLDPLIARYGPFQGSDRVRQARVARLERARGH